MKPPSPLTPSQAGFAPAMMLIETLVAAAILAAAAMLFLVLLGEARFALAQSRLRAEAATLAVSLLGSPADGDGQSGAYSWRRRCSEGAAGSPRFSRTHCELTLSWRGAGGPRSLVFERDFARPSAAPRAP